MKYIELLSPVGDFECLKAAVQNGANAVYLGASNFSARASAKNFNLIELEEAINYATLRNVDVHLALNTLIKNDEFNDALELAKNAYELGVSAIIVQDIGLATYIHKYLPNLPIHASTQMTIHNLEGVLQAKKLGFSRVVLSRELNLNEIEFIRNNTDVELEVFIHGAICISYSGQCLLSSMIGGRSGNRGKCAQACRLPYELVKNSSNNTSVIDKGYLLSPRDLCGLEFIPNLINYGITSLKIEGRMKTPEYVATVTRIYRKYINMAINNEDYVIDDIDIKDLQQVFNRGGFSKGHLDSLPNQDLVFKEKSNNMGVYIGNVSHFNSNKGHINLNLNDRLAIGDTITFENEPTKYKISELMINNKNCEKAVQGQTVKIGRMKGNINIGDKIFKLESKTLSSIAKQSYKDDIIKNKLTCNIKLKASTPIVIDVTDSNNNNIHITSNIVPEVSKTSPITKERIITQFSKTGSTPFEFEKFNIDLDDNLYINIADLNELRRNILSELENKIINSKKKTAKPIHIDIKNINTHKKQKQISILFNILNVNYNYNNLEDVDNVYIPLKYFENIKYIDIIKDISSKYNTYIYMPTIIKPNYKNLFSVIIEDALEKYNIKGFVISNLGNIELLSKYKDKYEFIGNYTLNVFNSISSSLYSDLGLNRVTLSVELNEDLIKNISNSTTVPTELIVYGNTPVMNLRYCLLGQSNKCYPNCSSLCKNEDKYYLKDRLNFNFRIIPDNTQTVTTIYNSKTTSIVHSNLNVDCVRIDILDENISEINNIIKTVKSGNRLEGKDYTNGNFAKDV